MRHLKTTLAVLGAVTVLVLAGNTIALATTGQAFLLGKSNSANAVTTLTRTTSGPAFKITNLSPASAPFVTNGTGKVANLNADKVDGLDSASFKTSTRLYTQIIGVEASAGFTMTTASVPAGSYLGSLNGFIYGPTTGSGLDCYFNPGNGGDLREVWIPISAQGFYGVQVTGVITLNTAQSVNVHCGGPVGSYTSYSGSPLQLALTKIDTLTTGSSSKVSVHRTAPRGAAH